MEPNLGHRVRIDIPDELDPDFEFHGEHAVVLEIKSNECPCGYGLMYHVALETLALTLDVHPWDIRPAIPLAKDKIQKRV